MAIGLTSSDLLHMVMERWKSRVDEGVGHLQAEAAGEQPSGQIFEMLREIDRVKDTWNSQTAPFFMVSFLVAVLDTIEANNAQIELDLRAALGEERTTLP